MHGSWTSPDLHARRRNLAKRLCRQRGRWLPTDGWSWPGSGWVVTRRADEVTSFGDARLWSETTRVDLRVAEAPAPRPGDRIELDGDAFLIQDEPVRDRERLVWTLNLRSA